MAGRDIIVIGASAGGVQALREIISCLPADLPAAVFVVLHINPHGRSALPHILSRRSTLPVHHAEEGEAITMGRVYVAPPDMHLAVDQQYVRLSHGPSENNHRPAIDVLFRTAARAFGRRVIGVVLTGNLDDGTSGLSFVKHHGGLTVVQDPAEADYPGMPESAIRSVAIDHVLPIADIGPLLDRLAREPLPDEADPPAGAEDDPRDMQWEPEFEIEPEAKPSGLTCPACGGSLWESVAAGPLHFRCRTGHAYSPESLSAKQTESLESALWAAIRSLEENAALARGLANRLHIAGSNVSPERFLKKAQVAEEHAQRLRRLLYEKVEEDAELEPSRQSAS